MTADRATEVRRASLQFPVEMMRGLEIAEKAWKLGKFGDGLQIIRDLRSLIPLHELMIRELIKEATR